MTLYRMARESQIVQALMEAAENGKEVVALVELRARFDEQNNIDWSKQLEEAGCTVLYGFEDYKVHSKLTLITKKGAAGLQLYHPDRHRQLQREDQRALHRLFLHHGRPRHRRGGLQRLPESRRPEIDGDQRKDAGGSAALQERSAG